MSTRSQVQFEWGTATEISSFTGVDREVVVDATNRRLVIMDGTTAGGAPQASEAYVQAQLASAGVSMLLAPQGRLTLTSGTPIMTANVAGAIRLYYTPAAGNRVPIYSGTAFSLTPFAEIFCDTTDATKSPAACVPSSLYDLFVWSDGGTVRLSRGPAWSAGGGSNTSRGAGAGSTALTMVDGILVNANAITNGPAANCGTYVGTVMTDASSQLNMVFGGSSAGGTAAILGVWNAYNRVQVQARARDTTVSWSYTPAAIRSVNGSNNNRVTFVTGLAADSIFAEYQTNCTLNGVGAYGIWGFAMDGANAFDRCVGCSDTAASNAYGWLGATGWYPPQLGQHFIQATEQGNGTSAAVFSGAGSGFNTQGMEVSLLM